MWAELCPLNLSEHGSDFLYITTSNRINTSLSSVENFTTADSNCVRAQRRFTNLQFLDGWQVFGQQTRNCVRISACQSYAVIMHFRAFNRICYFIHTHNVEPQSIAVEVFISVRKFRFRQPKFITRPDYSHSITNQSHTLQTERWWIVVICSQNFTNFKQTFVVCEEWVSNSGFTYVSPIHLTFRCRH